jgi:biotin transport system substrate-specific component
VTKVALVAGLACGFAVAAQLRVPMHPVPMTLQTAAVFAAALLLGWRLAAGAVAVYLIAAIAGLPVLSGGGSFAEQGLFGSKTAGYVLGFAPAVWCFERLRPVTWGRAFVAASLAHGVVLALGWSWLATHIGALPAWWHGVVPFALGALAKSALVASLVRLRRADRAAQPGGDDSRTVR